MRWAQHVAELEAWDEVQLREMIVWTRAQLDAEMARTRELRQRARLSFVGAGASALFAAIFGVTVKPYMDGGGGATLSGVAVVLLIVTLGVVVATAYAYRVFMVSEGWAVPRLDVILPFSAPPPKVATYYAYVLLQYRAAHDEIAAANQARIPDLRRAEHASALTAIVSAVVAALILLGIVVAPAFGDPMSNEKDTPPPAVPAPALPSAEVPPSPPAWSPFGPGASGQAHPSLPAFRGDSADDFGPGGTLLED